MKKANKTLGVSVHETYLGYPGTTHPGLGLQTAGAVSLNRIPLRLAINRHPVPGVI